MQRRLEGLSRFVKPVGYLPCHLRVYTDEPLSKYCFLWRHFDHRDHGHGSFRKLGERISELKLWEPTLQSAAGWAPEMG